MVVSEHGSEDEEQQYPKSSRSAQSVTESFRTVAGRH